MSLLWATQVTMPSSFLCKYKLLCSAFPLLYLWACVSHTCIKLPPWSYWFPITFHMNENNWFPRALGVIDCTCTIRAESYLQYILNFWKSAKSAALDCWLLTQGYLLPKLLIWHIITPYTVIALRDSWFWLVPNVLLFFFLWDLLHANIF